MVGCCTWVMCNLLDVLNGIVRENNSAFVEL